MVRLRNGTAVALVLAASWLAPVALAGDYAEFDSPVLREGRSVWLENCEGCHGYGIGGAPVPTEADDWRDRLVLPRNTLYAHALEGFYGPGDTIMPARGGNPLLSDREVRLAVDYMVHLARHHQPQGD